MNGVTSPASPNNAYYEPISAPRIEDIHMFTPERRDKQAVRRQHYEEDAYAVEVGKRTPSKLSFERVSSPPYERAGEYGRGAVPPTMASSTSEYRHQGRSSAGDHSVGAISQGDMLIAAK